MYLEAKYTIIKYYEELMEEDIEELKKYIDKGIIVHLFLKGSFSEELELNQYDCEYLQDEGSKIFFHVYDNCTYDFDGDKVINVDGKIINKEAFEIICNDKKSDFNSEQFRIVTAEFNSNIIVTAGAGTGKTTTMVNRLIFLREMCKDFKFEDAVLITFTNKAGREMREKLIEKLDNYYRKTKKIKYLDMMDEVLKTNISTIHKFSEKLINEYGKYIGINKDIKIKSYKYERSNAVTEALNKIYKENKELYQVIKNYPLYKLENKIIKIWDKLDDYSLDFNSNKYSVEFDSDDREFSRVLYKTIKYAQEIIDREKEADLEVNDLMKKLSNEDLYVHLRGRYKVIMMDEFQDSDDVQINFLINFCKATGCNFLVVGDEKQSIYRFRGANYTAFDKLKNGVENTKNLSISMVRNYRTDAALLGSINNIFIDIDRKLKKFIYKEEDYIYSKENCENKNGLNLIDTKDNNDKVEFYNSLVSKESIESIAVIMRSNNEIKEFKKFCDRNKILCLIDDTGGFFRHEAVRDFYVMIKSLITNNDNAVLYSLASTPYIDGELDKAKILNGDHKAIKDYLKDFLRDKGWSQYIDKLIYMDPLSIIDEIIEKQNPVKNYYRRILSEAKRDKKEYNKYAEVKALEYKLNLEHLIYLIKKNFAESITSIYSIENYLKLKIATDISIDPRRPKQYEKKYIKCITVHKAKGLEFDCVIMENLNKQFIQNSENDDVIIRNEKENKKIIAYKILMDKDDEFKSNNYYNYFKEERPEIQGEEARLLYVALTRCKHKLYLNMNSGLSATENLNTWKSLLSEGVMKYV